MTKHDEREKTEAAHVSNDDDEVIKNKKSITLEDFKGAILDDRKNSEVVEDEGDSGKNVRRLFFGKIILWAFSILLFITGVFIALFTFYTGIGIIFGAALIIAAVCLPFVARGDWIKRYVK